MDFNLNIEMAAMQPSDMARHGLVSQRSIRRMTPEVLIYAKRFSGLAIISDDTPPKGVA